MSLSIVDQLENECYLKNPNDALNNEVKSKIEEFSNWFTTARLYLLRCPPEENETFIYLLLNLKKKLKFALSEISKSVSYTKQTFTCNVCAETVEIQPQENIWSKLQEHPHFEETYNQLYEFDDNFENGESSTNDDISEDLNQTVHTAESTNGLNDFKFNFIVTYDHRVEEALYPEPLILAARRRDSLSEYTIQRCGVGRGNCLLCPCSLLSRGRVSKITSFVIKNHCSGQRHLKYASNPLNTNALKQYHEFWRSQDPNFQAHQLHFIPELPALNCVKCQLCQEVVNYNVVIEHIKDKSHRNKVLKIFPIPEGKLTEFYLLDMQVEVYGVVVNNVKKEEIEKVKEMKNGGSAPPKCVTVKFVVDPNGIMLPPRHNEHLAFLKRNLDVVTCILCKMNFKNDRTDIRNHIYSAQHKQASGVSYSKYNFFCEICNAHIKDEVAWEDHFIKGPNRHDSMPQGRKQKVAEYECKTCMTVIYGDEMSLKRHSSRGGKPGRAKEVKIPFSVKKLFGSTNFIDDQARCLQVEAIQVIDHQKKMQKCLEDLEEALRGIYPNCKAYPFGSRISGLGNHQSDLDVFMDTGDMYLGTNYQDSQTQEQFVKKVAKVLKSFKEDFSHVLPIPSARTPIVKVHHNFTKLDCDISFRHGLGVENTKFLRFCIDLQPITQPFILLLKKWSDCCKLNEHITNYGLALMAVFFLQTSGYLLPVKTVRNYNPTQSLIIDGWDTLNYTVAIERMREFVKPYNANIKQLLRDFFFYFCKFDYANQVVCPLLGTTIPKLLFNEKPDENLPIEMKSYIQRIQSENGEQFRGLSPFCIQDPFDLSHNLTKACQHGTITKLKAFCTLTYEFIDSIE
ncbi:hypothetical protein Zmor_009745 [Zophobas morio]|uniref:Terminal uridylyltransferase 7 n=2 Tax=Zophobas morio TaxID=2755281 RepID=A0AA38IPM2_9CUCU|nr:hypothetical protein Zmor_009745 [Zophobas morio]